MLPRRIDILLHLTGRDWLDMAEAWVRLLFLSARKPKVRFEEISDAQVNKRTEEVGTNQDVGTARRLQRLVSIAARLQPFRSACLVRARCLHRMLAKRGIASRLCIGVNRNLAGFASHAWVEVNGQAIGEPQDITDRFKVLAPVQ